MSTGGVYAGAEGALTGMWALFPARKWGLKSTGFQCTLPPPTPVRDLQGDLVPSCPAPLEPKLPAPLPRNARITNAITTPENP